VAESQRGRNLSPHADGESNIGSSIGGARQIAHEGRDSRGCGGRGFTEGLSVYFFFYNRVSWSDGSQPKSNGENSANRRSNGCLTLIRGD
jgi:hypothetical protein